VHVALLRPLEVRTDGDPGKIVEVAGARLRALLIMLALHPGQLVTASQLIDGLWPQEMPAGAGNALQAPGIPVAPRPARGGDRVAPGRIPADP
jgi:DNA-binding SARP family transcriptional activator